jgi:tungstate transport system substrate-binding protein
LARIGFIWKRQDALIHRKGRWPELSRNLKKLLILSICVLPLLLTLFYQVSNVNANSPLADKDVSTGIGSSVVSQSNWPDWLNWTIREDLNLDLKVNLVDLVILANAYGTTPASGGIPGALQAWNPYGDINDNGKIDLADLVSLALHYGWVGTMPSPSTLIVSSTTSLYETGVEDAMKAVFEAKFPWITINFLSQGTGAAIQTAMRGDADMIMVHDPVQENTFMVNGYGVNRKIMACNFFIIVGPEGDPAGVAGMTPLDALRQIKTLGEQGQAIWVSRGDGSGTNSAEKRLWAAAGINWTQIRTETSWYKETGQGMTATLLVANELGGYTLSDTASYLTNTNNGNIQMEIVVQAARELLNVYSLIVDNPLNANLTETNFAASMLFVQYVVSLEGQNLLANYGTETFGAPLFTPFVPIAMGSNATLLSWIQSFAYLPANATECATAYRCNAGPYLYANSWDNP